MRFPFLIFFVFLKLAFATSSKLPSGYHIVKEIKVDNLVSLQLLTDVRVNKKMEFEEVPQNARNGILRVLNKDGVEITRQKLEKPRVDMEFLKGKRGDKFFFFVTEDWSIDFGSYNGPISTLYLLENEKLSNTNISLMRSLKSGWKVKEKGKNGYPEIFRVKCYPDFKTPKDKEMQFKVLYSHFIFDGETWTENKRERNGCWHSEESFPKEKMFP